MCIDFMVEGKQKVVLIKQDIGQGAHFLWAVYKIYIIYHTILKYGCGKTQSKQMPRSSALNLNLTHQVAYRLKSLCVAYMQWRNN